MAGKELKSNDSLPILARWPNTGFVHTIGAIFQGMHCYKASILADPAVTG
jgi:hypothetical protein